MKKLVIIGAGPAGLAAAVSAYESGARDILLLEREEAPGGILKQCIHAGFGLHKFGEELTGPEYAHRYKKAAEALPIGIKCGTTVLSVSDDKVVTAQNDRDGVFSVRADAIILAMGCRERPGGALLIPGERPAGVYTAGTAQKMINRMGFLPGKEVVILGSGDIGLIMARRLTLEGAHVICVCEIERTPGGLARNIAQCLTDFDIPLLLRHTVTEIRGGERLSGVTVAEVDENKKPIPKTERKIRCDTLLLSVGLLPENELSRMMGLSIDPRTGGVFVDQNRETEKEGVFACGNVLHVHDLVDHVSDEAEITGRSAAEYLSGREKSGFSARILPGTGIRCAVPQRLTKRADTEVFFRVSAPTEEGTVCIYADGTILRKEKRRFLTPGRMESVRLGGAPDENVREIRICMEEVR